MAVPFGFTVVLAGDVPVVEVAPVCDWSGVPADVEPVLVEVPVVLGLAVVPMLPVVPEVVPLVWFCVGELWLDELLLVPAVLPVCATAMPKANVNPTARIIKRVLINLNSVSILLCW